MKKFFLFVMAIAAMSASAKVAYLLPKGTAYDAETKVLTGFPAEEINGVAQNPELNAAEWFKATYVTCETPTGVFVTPAEFAASVVENELDGSVTLPDYEALWIHIDRVDEGNSIDEAKASYGFNEDFTYALTLYVANGGNLLLSKQATHLVGDMGRAEYPEYNRGGYFKKNEQWFVSTNFGGQDNSGHMIYRRHNGDFGGESKNVESAWVKDVEYIWNEEHTEIVDSILYNVCTDHNCGWGGKSDEDLTAWQAANHARVLGTWGGCTKADYLGYVEFYPYSMTATMGETTIEMPVVKGTVLCLGLATYMWNTNNRGWGGDNVRHLTSCALEYLTAQPKNTEGGDLYTKITTDPFFYPAEVEDDARMLHPVVENLQASYVLVNTVPANIASFVTNPEGKEPGLYLVFTAEGEANFVMTLRETRELQDWTLGWYTYDLSMTYSKTTTLINASEAAQKAIKTIENGQIVIIKNGVRYNALGAQL